MPVYTWNRLNPFVLCTLFNGEKQQTESYRKDIQYNYLFKNRWTFTTVITALFHWNRVCALRVVHVESSDSIGWPRLQVTTWHACSWKTSSNQTVRFNTDQSAYTVQWNKYDTDTVYLRMARLSISSIWNRIWLAYMYLPVFKKHTF